MPTSPHAKKPKSRLAPKTAAILLITSAGKITDVVMTGTVGHVLLADAETLKGLSPEDRERTIINGIGSLVVTHKQFEDFIEELVNPAESSSVPVEAPALPATEPTQAETPIPTTPATDAMASPVEAPAVDPTAATAVALNEALTPAP